MRLFKYKDFDEVPLWLTIIVALVVYALMIAFIVVVMKFTIKG